MARSLFTKLVGKDEVKYISILVSVIVKHKLFYLLNQVGKIFSAVAVIAAVFPMISDPIYKKLYNATLSTFPAAFFLLVLYSDTIPVVQQ